MENKKSSRHELTPSLPSRTLLVHHRATPSFLLSMSPKHRRSRCTSRRSPVLRFRKESSSINLVSEQRPFERRVESPIVRSTGGLTSPTRLPYSRDREGTKVPAASAPGNRKEVVTESRKRQRSPEDPTPTEPLERKKRSAPDPDQTSSTVDAQWRAMLPTLVEPLAYYLSSTKSKSLQPLPNKLQGACIRNDALSARKRRTILCLGLDRECSHLCHVLSH